MTLNINSVEHYSGQDITAGNLNAPHNEIVSYINNLQTVQYVTSNITKTVGSGGDFTTLQDAIDFFGTLIPNKNAVRGTIMLKSGFRLNEGVRIESKNLGWVDIKSEDPNVMANPNASVSPPNPADTRQFTILGSKSTMPNIYCNIVAEANSVNNYRVLGAFNQSSVEIGGAGVGVSGGGAIRNENSSGSNPQSIEIAASFCYALDGIFDNILLNINSNMLFRNGTADNIYVAGYSYIEISGASYNSLNIPVNTFNSYGIAFDR